MTVKSFKKKKQPLDEQFCSIPWGTYNIDRNVAKRKHLVVLEKNRKDWNVVTELPLKVFETVVVNTVKRIDKNFEEIIADFFVVILGILKKSLKMFPKEPL